MTRPPLPPFTEETATQKVRAAEGAWNTRDPARMVLAYTADSRWRNRVEFPQGREEIRTLLDRKRARELNYRLVKELWISAGDRIAGRFAYEYHDGSRQWFRACGNENWRFDVDGLTAARFASITNLRSRRPAGACAGPCVVAPTTTRASAISDSEAKAARVRSMSSEGV